MFDTVYRVQFDIVDKVEDEIGEPLEIVLENKI